MAAGVFVADTSAWHRVGSLPDRKGWDELIDAGRIATCPIVVLELAFSCRNVGEIGAREQALRQLPSADIDGETASIALEAIRILAAQQPGFHRVAPADALIAACARQSGFGVIHYDAHYDRLGDVLGIETRWIAEPGSL